MSMGTGILHSKSSKQKLNNKSSTEVELVGVSDYLPYNIWLINFMKSQGYDITRNVMYQDNQSAMKMEINVTFTNYMTLNFTVFHIFLHGVTST